MRFVLSVILIIILSAIAEQLFPWWTIAVVSFAVTLIVRTPKPFLAGFVAIILFWLCIALMKDIPNEHILSTCMAGVLPLHGNYILLIIITVLIGGLVGGLAAWSGGLCRKIFSAK